MPPVERTAILFDPQVLDCYVSVYETENDVFTITREGNALFLQKTQNPKKGEILAESPTTFFLRDDPVTISFETNAGGDVDRTVVTPPD